MKKVFKYGLLFLAFTQLTPSYATDEDVIGKMFADLRFRHNLYVNEISEDLKKIEDVIKEDFSKNRFPYLISQLASQRLVYSLSVMNNEILEKIAHDSLDPIQKNILHQTKVNYIQSLKDNELIENDEFNLYMYLLNSSL